MQFVVIPLLCAERKEGRQVQLDRLIRRRRQPLNVVESNAQSGGSRLQSLLRLLSDLVLVPGNRVAGNGPQ